MAGAGPAPGDRPVFMPANARPVDAAAAD